MAKITKADLQRRIDDLEHEVFIVRKDRDRLQQEFTQYKAQRMTLERGTTLESIARMTDAIAHAIKFAGGGDAAI